MMGQNKGPNKASQAMGRWLAPAESGTAAHGVTCREAGIWAEPETWACETLMEGGSESSPFQSPSWGHHKWLILFEKEDIRRHLQESREAKRCTVLKVPDASAAQAAPSATGTFQRPQSGGPTRRGGVACQCWHRTLPHTDLSHGP